MNLNRRGDSVSRSDSDRSRANKKYLFLKAMALPSQVEQEETYGAIKPRASNRRTVRVLMVAAAMAMCMAATVMMGSSSAADSFEDEVELEILNPDAKLEKVVSGFVQNSTSMTVAQMVSKLDQWRNDPDTLRNLPREARTQVQCQFTFFLRRAAI